MNARVLVLAQKRSYRADDVLTAATQLGVRLTLGTDRCHVLAEAFQDDVLTLERLDDRQAVVDAVTAAHRTAPFSAVLGTCDQTSALAALVSQALRLVANPAHAAELARNKALQRACLLAVGVAVPRHFLVENTALDIPALAQRIGQTVGWPAVIKPVLLSGSRGVMRVDDTVDLAIKVPRLLAILRDPELRVTAEVGHQQMLVEQFIPGMEVAVECLLRDGALEVLAFFDKPDPLDGPFFEETLYVTPSRLPPEVQERCVATVQAAASAMGLRQGPVHAELRLMPGAAGLTPVVMEAAARSIGGLCSRTLVFGTGRSLDEVVLEAALGRSSAAPPRREGASGVMMIPIRRAGILHGVDGVEAARALPGVDEISITARAGEELVPLPEGQSYLGFIFARSGTPQGVEQVLREAHAQLTFNIHGKLPITG